MAIVFFFQAEDGIRDTSVTGVQTCALPISPHQLGMHSLRFALRRSGNYSLTDCLSDFRLASVRESEERRVGKECRSRGVGWREKKKKIHRARRLGQK